MGAFKWNNEHDDARYRNRVMGAVIGVEVVLILLFNFWPVSSNESEIYMEDTGTVTSIIKAPTITRQSGGPTAPQAPQVPVQVPNDVVIEEQEIQFLEFSGTGEAKKLSPKAGTAGGTKGKIYHAPELAPSIVYIVEPTIENRTDKKALIYVKFLVDKRGNVQKAMVDRIFLFNDEGKPVIEVEQISQRVISATIKAALQWKFRPAKVNGQPVRAYTLQTFTIDY